MSAAFFLNRCDTWQDVVKLIESENGDIKGNWKLDSYLQGSDYNNLILYTSTHYVTFEKQHHFGVYRYLKK